MPAPTYVNVAGFYEIATNPETFSLANPTSGGGRCLLVHYVSGGNVSVSSITYGGVALTRVTRAIRTAATYLDNEIWVLLNPATGTNNLVISGADAGSYFYVTWYTGVGFVTGKAQNVSSFAIGTTYNSSSTGLKTDDLLVDFFLALNTNISPATGQTAMIDFWRYGIYHGASRKVVPSDGTYNMGWSNDGDNNSALTHCVVALSPLISGSYVIWWA